MVVLLRYLEFYARLARPDIVQLTFNDARRFKRERTASLYSAQQLALLRFAVDRAAATANHSHYLLKTAPFGIDPKSLANRVESQLTHKSAEDIAHDAMNRYRKAWLSIKVFHYTALLALAWLIGKWILGEKVRFLAMSSANEQIAMVAFLVVLVPLILHIFLRYTNMGILTAPPLIDSLSPNRSGKGRLGAWLYKRTGPKVPLENDLRAREILRVAFPAAPADFAAAEIHELLWAAYPSQSPRISWQLRLALGWARFARRFSFIEPMLAGEHGLNQRLALMWVRNLVQMVPPDYQHSSATVDAISGEIHKFICFVERNFARTPFALASDDVQALSAFVADNADPAATRGLLELATGGFVGLLPRGSGGIVSKHLDYYINFAQEPLSKAGQRPQISGFERSKPSDIRKHVDSATIMSFATVINQLSRKRTYLKADASLVATLKLMLDTRNMPMSAALYRSAFSAATEVLRDPETSSLLAMSFEQRYLEGDRYVTHIVRRAHVPKPLGWKLPSAIPAGKDVQSNALVDCLSPYVAHLAHITVDSMNSSAKTDHVAAFVERWNTLDILGPESCVQCLYVAIRSVGAPKTEKRLAAEIAEQWVLLGFKFANATLSKASVSLASKESVVRALYQFLEYALKVAAAAHAKQCGMCVFNKWRDMANRHPAITTHATATFNSQLIGALSEHPQSRMDVMQALKILDLMHGLGQTPKLQALDALCWAASRESIDVSRQVDYWTHRIKSKAKDIKMNEFVESLF
ncbi:hypothetical protein GGI22_003077 [Coemansia erecta]|nr:hypothetical protein GGI22_003077 [Coemansia erecta]